MLTFEKYYNVKENCGRPHTKKRNIDKNNTKLCQFLSYIQTKFDITG